MHAHCTPEPGRMRAKMSDGTGRRMRGGSEIGAAMEMNSDAWSYSVWTSPQLARSVSI